MAKKKKKRRSVLKRIILTMIVIIIAAAGLVAAANFYVMHEGGKTVITAFNSHDTHVTDNTVNYFKDKTPQCILILGAAVRVDGFPALMLEDRLEAGIKLYKAGAAPKILLSGDNGTLEYNELKSMHDYVSDAGVPEKDIFTDYAGFSTYESMYRARDVFMVRRLIVVTQKYHLYRAAYIGNKLGMDVWGVSSDQDTYSGQKTREIREMLARSKDLLMCIFKPQPTYLGKEIPITGSGLKSRGN